ncbi:MAG: hypothetical protein ACTSXZ_08780, partial [Alphaproteobacteria bacterium]
MPATAAAAVLMAVGLAQIQRVKVRRIVTGVSVGLALLLYLAVSLSPARAAHALGLFARPPQTLPQAVELTQRATRHGPVAAIAEAWHPYLPGGMLGYLTRLADPEVPIYVTDLRRDHEAVSAQVMEQIPRAGSLLLLHAGSPQLPEEVLAQFQPVKQAAWRYGTYQVVLELRERPVPTNE